MTPRRLKRQACVLVLLLLAGGAIMNVAVAWGFAAFARLDRLDFGRGNTAAKTGQHPCWIFYIRTGFGAYQVESEPSTPRHVLPLKTTERRMDMVPSWSRMWRLPDKDATAIVEDARGWPCLAMYCRFIRTPQTIQVPMKLAPDKYGPRVGFNVWYVYETLDGLSLPPGHDVEMGYSRALPLIPLWPGFAVNTIFYAAILALLFYGPGKVRRLVRVRRWRCPACAYLIAPGTCASGLCSECGATLTPGGRLVRPATPAAGEGTAA